MKFANIKDVLSLAEEKQIAYGAYVTVSYDSALAAIEAGSELNTPVIFITGYDCVELMGGFEGTVETVKRAAMNATVPIVLHLDHSKSYAECTRAINAGYSSVMIDGSGLPFEENIAITKKVVDFAHPLGISVEGELGRLVGEEGTLIVKGPEAAQTDPEQAKEFVERTGIDCLAVSIGTQHGYYTSAPKINIERLKTINEIVNVPLVLHGGSGTPITQVQESIKNGIRKINIATDVIKAMVNQYVELAGEADFKYNTLVYPKVKDAMKEMIKQRMKQFMFEA